METDPLTAEQTEVLWVKGSGGDLRTSKLANFSSLYQDKLIALQSIYGATEPNGVKTPVEDEMVHMYPHTTFNLNPRPSSIDTPCTVLLAQSTSTTCTPSLSLRLQPAETRRH